MQRGVTSLYILVSIILLSISAFIVPLPERQYEVCADIVKDCPQKWVLGDTLFNKFRKNYVVKQTLPPNQAILDKTNPEKIDNQETKNNNLFFAYSSGRNNYKIGLYDPHTQKIINQSAVDLSTLGWDVITPDSKFNKFNGTLPVQYGPKTGKIIFLLRPNPGGEGGNKDPNALPDPPFTSAIYDTSFNENRQLDEIYRSQEYIEHITLNKDKNLLIFTIEKYKSIREIDEEIWTINLDNKEAKKVATIQADPQRFEEYSDIRLGTDSTSVKQLVLYSLQGSHPASKLWKDQRLDLKTIDIVTGNVSTTTIHQGNAIDSEIDGLSPNSMKVAFFAEPNSNNLWIKDLQSDQLISVALNDSISHDNLYWSGDSNKLLVGEREGSFYYDISKKERVKTPLEYALAWEPSNQYIVSKQRVISQQGDKTIIIYDIKNQKETSLDINFDGLVSLQFLSD